MEVGSSERVSLHPPDERRAAGQGVSKIARELQLDRKTGRSSVRRSAWSQYRRQVSAPTMLDAHRQLLSERAPRATATAELVLRRMHDAGHLTWAQLQRLRNPHPPQGAP